jgi:hypothetical protein
MAKIALIGGTQHARAVLGEYGMTAVLVGRNPDHRYELISPRTLAA